MVKQVKVPPAKVPAAKAVKAATPVAKAGKCAWCEKGECWTHGQIEKPDRPARKANDGNGKDNTTVAKGGGKGKAFGGKAQALLAMLGGGQAGQMQALMTMLMGGAAGADADADNAPNANGDWKCELYGAVSKSLGRVVTKDEITYEVYQIEGGNGQSYQSSVTVSGQTFNGEAAVGKKKAEQSAAQVALAELFPERGFGRGKKRTVAGEAKVKLALTPKQQLSEGIAILVKEPMTKESIVYTCAEAAAGGMIATVKIATLGRSFSGKAQPTQKDAEKSAAEAAFKQLKAKIEPAVAAHKAIKETKKKETLAALVESTKAKKAAKIAAGS